MGQKHGEAEITPETKAERGSKHGGGQLDAPLRVLMMQGHPTPQAVAQLMREYPMQREAMMATAQRELGNAFVQQVMTQIDAPGSAASSMSGMKSPLPTGSVFELHKGDQADAIIANVTRFADVADQHVGSANVVLASYGRARDALDKDGVGQLGTTVFGSLEVLRAAIEGMDEQLAKYRDPQCVVGGDPAIEFEEANKSQRIAALRNRRDQLSGVFVPIQTAALNAMTPLQWRGAAVPDVLPLVPHLDPTGKLDVREQVKEEWIRTMTILHGCDRLFKQFAKPGAVNSASERFTAYHEIKQFGHRPMDLAFLRSILMNVGLWQALNTEDEGPGALPGLHKPKTGVFDVEVCTDDGPLSGLYKDTQAQAKRTGASTDVGNYDDGLATLEIRMGGNEALHSVYGQVMSATPDGRAAILYDLQRRGILEAFLNDLPWAFTKDMHDGLPGGHGELRSALQAHFLVEGKWGTSLEIQEYHAPSLTKIIRGFGKDVGGIGEDVIDGFDSALNFMTLGFTHSYGEANDLHNEGLINDSDYSSAMRQVAVRTTVGMAIMMGTAGMGRAAMGAGGAAAPTMMGMQGGRTVAQTALATGVEGATFATTEMFALDTADVMTGAKREYSDITDYLKVAMLGGTLGAAVGGTTSWLTSRTAARYLPRDMLTRGQALAADNPSLAPVLDQLQGAPMGSMMPVRITAAQADALAEAGVIDQAAHKALRVALAEHGEVEATMEVIADLNVPGAQPAAKAAGGKGAPGGKGPTASEPPSLGVRTVGPANTPAGQAGGATTAARTTLQAGLPKGAVVTRTGGAGGDGWVVYKDAAGVERIRFRSAQSKTFNEANPGRNDTVDARAGINTEGNAYVLEGKHRSIGNAKGDVIPDSLGGVKQQPGVLDFPFETEVIDDIGVWVKDQKIDYTMPDVGPAEAAARRALRFKP